ncbi:helix-turn-helix domain-containing protein [Plantactinospora sp. GCM10030261]|uniref:helix-turn-helix domain-containing protein n=1 Tax=Plantactinospora sp. GCM10030261 TaxID=3273420 RepID=UPI0036146E42
MDRFANLLKHHRVARRMTQETLAEQAGVSSRSIGEMERGRRCPRPRTIEQLAVALRLAGDARAEFVEIGLLQHWSGRVTRASGPVNDRPTAAPARSGATEPDAATRPDVPAPRGLPGDLPDFVGRESELRTLRAALSPAAGEARFVAISGPAGIGKSALAVHLAHAVASWFPDGQVFVALDGSATADPAEAIGRLLHTLDPGLARVPPDPHARAALLRSTLAGRRLLLVLDGAVGHAQVMPFLPTADSAVIVTSRLPLTGLPGVTTVDLPPLTVPDSIRLLSNIAGERRVVEDLGAVGELVAICGGLPLAVRILGAKLSVHPRWTAGALLARLADERYRLDELSHGDLAIRPRLRESHRSLSPLAATAFGLLGGLELSSFTEWMSTRLVGLDRPAGGAVLRELLDARLVSDAGLDVLGQPRFRLPAVVRLYAREHHPAAVRTVPWHAALERVVDGWLVLARVAVAEMLSRAARGTVTEAVPVHCPERVSVTVARDPVAWFAAEREVMADMVRVLRDAGLEDAAMAIDEHRDRLRALLG